LAIIWLIGIPLPFGFFFLWPFCFSIFGPCQISGNSPIHSTSGNFRILPPMLLLLFAYQLKEKE
jgi:hypothetical protein